MTHQMQRLRPSFRSFCRLWMAGLVAVALTACAETEFVLHTAKHLGDSKPTPIYKVGDPYQIDGVWYRPAIDYSYVETGVASWYGADFHNRPTANGEIYNMELVSAAHRTLPLPSVVRVTNLENGRSLKVRVNDRGPFARGRIIDMSKRGAELLGFRDQGTAKVRVEILAGESRQLAGIAPSATPEPAPPPVILASAEPKPAPTETVSPPEPVVTTELVAPTQLFIQAGAFSRYESATNVRSRLETLGETNVTPVTVGDLELYRVRLGPLANVEEADAKLSEVVKAGYPEARLIVD
ncbi:MAG: septal ring lytic transglycosylase RlpA family protein [Alphaproteobacteria bacterium]|nr:septal ring lytic transglycosylase RlpA family protein [Alphaproteobacteria bacterium]